MVEARVERRLAAILVADVAGYSRLMSEDEQGTLSALQAHRSGLIDPAIGRHHGRIVKLMGDGLLAEFVSVVEAVDCAAEIQREMAARNAGNKCPIVFRIGVHLGDVIVESGDLYGDGVNIAARLEGISEPGGICISRQAYEHVQKRLSLGYRRLGPQNLKNIPDPVEAFAIKGDGLALADKGWQSCVSCSGYGRPAFAPASIAISWNRESEEPNRGHGPSGLQRSASGPAGGDQDTSVRFSGGPLHFLTSTDCCVRINEHFPARPTKSFAARKHPWQAPSCGLAIEAAPSPIHTPGRLRARRSECFARRARQIGPPSLVR